MQKRQRGFVLALCLCILSVSGIYGLQRYRSGQAAQEPEEQVAESEETSEEQETETANSEDTVAQVDTEDKETEEAKIETEEDIYEIGEATLARTETDSVTAQVPAEGTPEEENTEETEKEAEEAEETLAGENLLSFADNSSLMWPVDGEIILEYSMDKSIYFSTLNQYKYHPAIVIDAEVGDEVWCTAQGIVSEIRVDEETGTTLTMTLGSGYEAIYGQLKELTVQEGDMVEAGSLIGYISEPTKYYTREGSNLYFQLLRDGEPVDPTEYLN
ncbi:MAG: M23 family metallopeptidase [Lachnospiraceae bacterium]|nr:M23 family metallopeptidase [Lachnospiraceae bacterium]